MSRTQNSGKNKSKKQTQAEQADKHALYLRSVQEPEAEIGFFDRVFRNEFKRRAVTLREDFCGTAAICYEWAKSHKSRTAVGVDIDPDPLEWGTTHLATKLNDEQRSRVSLLQEDVRVKKGKCDVLAAQNFSFWIFRTRDEVRDYFKVVKKNLDTQGVFVMDMMGGSESLEEDRLEETEHDGFTYVWEQERYDPITHDCRFHIHFGFPDGSEMNRAFTYEWRMWTIPEIRELLYEAGFDQVDVYWEGTDEDGEGDGVFRKRKHAESDPAWIAYIVAVKDAKKK